MKTKGLTKQDAIKQLTFLTKQCEFNSELKKAIKQEIKKNPDVLLVDYYNYDLKTTCKRQVNGFNDSPNKEMIAFISKYLEEHGSFMSDNLKLLYIKQAAAIFGDTYSVCVNTYLRKDIKDLEAYIEMLDLNEMKNNNEDLESIEGATITRENGRLNIDFGGKVDNETYKVLRSNGFLYSPKFEQFTRQLTPNAEYSLKRVINQLKGANA